MLGRRGRHDVATALTLVFMLGLGALFLSFSVEYAPEIYSLLFGEVLGISTNQLGADHRARRSSASPRSPLLYRPLLLSSVLPDSPRRAGSRPHAIELALPAPRRARDDHDRPRRRHRAHLQPDDRAPGRRPLLHQPALHRDRAVGRASRSIVVWAAIALSYQTNWPVGFFVGVISAAGYAAGRAWTYARRNRVPAPRR